MNIQRPFALRLPRAVVLAADGALRRGLMTVLRADGVAVQGHAGHATPARCSGWADVLIVDADGAAGLSLVHELKACPACGTRPLVALITFPDGEQRRRMLAARADAVILKRGGEEIRALVVALAGPATG